MRIGMLIVPFWLRAHASTHSRFEGWAGCAQRSEPQIKDHRTSSQAPLEPLHRSHLGRRCKGSKHVNFGSYVVGVLFTTALVGSWSKLNKCRRCVLNNATATICNPMRAPTEFYTVEKKHMGRHHVCVCVICFEVFCPEVRGVEGF